ncbi:hypothetical protein CEXT_748451 [Caerostris extrusa]|uniref:Uncharacterized protein n=1 Tax=Caerostris extrusa TaxID=172846 RepID=A0AAV4N7U0_CAEEX|nr:hypothetical protein CEXT_748451 [Caerostris extrusa]
MAAIEEFNFSPKSFAQRNTLLLFIRNLGSVYTLLIKAPTCIRTNENRTRTCAAMDSLQKYVDTHFLTERKSSNGKTRFNQIIPLAFMPAIEEFNFSPKSFAQRNTPSAVYTNSRLCVYSSD